MFFLLLSLAFAKQLDVEIQKGSEEWSFSYTWKDAYKKKVSASFQLPSSEVRADNSIPTLPKMTELREAEVQAIRRYADGLPKGVKLKAWKSNGSVRMSVRSTKGRKAMKQAMKGAKAAAEKGADQWLAANGFMRADKTTIMVDYTRIVSEYTEEVTPVAIALGGGEVQADNAASVRKYLNRALSFVQSIPYERRGAGGKDAGYRRPLSLLARNKGDCDGKASLSLALVRAVLPDLPVAVVLIPNHAFVAVGIAAEPGELHFKREGQVFVVAEPVGPAVVGLGKASGKSKSRVRLGLIDVHTVQ